MTSIFYNGYRVKALRADLMPLAVVLDDVRHDAPPAPSPVVQPPLIALSEAPKTAPKPLMELPPGVAPAVKRRGHAGTPGRGPKGQTCGTCRHVLTRRGGNRAFPKCSLTRARWTGGAGSDVRRKDPACELWKGPNDGLGNDRADQRDHGKGELSGQDQGLSAHEERAVIAPVHFDPA